MSGPEDAVSGQTRMYTPEGDLLEGYTGWCRAVGQVANGWVQAAAGGWGVGWVVFGRMDMVIDGMEVCGSKWTRVGCGRLGLQLPQVMPNYPSVTLYYPFSRGNVVTQV